MLQQTLAVLLVLGLLLGTLWMLRRTGLATATFFVSQRRFGNTYQEKQMRLVERLPLTPQHTLHLVSLEGRSILLATSPAGCHIVEPASIAFKSGVAC